MRTFAFRIVLLVIAIPAFAQTIDTRGREFFISFLPNFGSGADTELSDLRIYLSSAEVALVTLTNNATGSRHQVGLPTPNTIVEVDLDQIFGNDVELRNGTFDSLSSKSILVEADREITLTGVSVRGKSADAFVAYPTDVLRGRNWVMAYGNGFSLSSDVGYDMPSQFAVIGIEDETVVEIIPSDSLDGRPAGEPYSVILDRGQVYFAQAVLGADNDVTGTEVNSTSPVAVFGGNRRTSIPRSIGNFRDHLVEQIPPTDAWGTEVIVAPFPVVDPFSTDSAVVRILSGDYENTWSIDDIPQGTLERGDFVDIPLRRAMRITAAASILVAQYDHSASDDQGSGFRLGDPCMMIVPAIDNYDTLYTFQSIPHPEFRVHYITIVAPSGSLESIELDGNKVAAAAGVFKAIPGSGFHHAQIEVAAGAHRIRGDSAFGVQVYGYGEAVSYAYTGGFVFRRLVTDVEVVTTPLPASALSEIFPNPTAGRFARISLDLRRGADFTIEVVNSTGDVVLRPVDGQHYAAGSHELVIEIGALPTGTYHIRATAGGRVDRRMLVITR